MAEISTLVDTTAVDMEQLADGVLALFKSLPVGSLDELTQGLYNVISAGVPAADALDFLRTASEAAVGGVTDVNTAVDGLTTAVNAFASQGLTATDAADAFFVAVKAGKTTFGEISSGIGQTASLAASLGISLDDLLANMVALTKGGISTSQAFTSLRAIFSNILKPTADFKREFPGLAKEFDQTALKTKGLTQFMVDLSSRLKDTTGGLGETAAGLGDGTAAASKMFGSVEGLNAALALTANGGASVRDVMDQMADKSGAAREAFDKMNETTDAQNKLLKNQLSAAWLEFGNLVLPTVNAALRGTLGVLNELNNLLKLLKGGPDEVDFGIGVSELENMRKVLKDPVFGGKLIDLENLKAGSREFGTMTSAINTMRSAVHTGVTAAFKASKDELEKMRASVLAYGQAHIRTLSGVDQERAARNYLDMLARIDEAIKNATVKTENLASSTGTLTGSTGKATVAARAHAAAQQAALTAAEGVIGRLTVATKATVDMIPATTNLGEIWKRNAGVLSGMADEVERQRTETDKQLGVDEKRRQSLSDQAAELSRVASGLIGAGQAAGILSSETAATLQNVVNIADSIAAMVISGSINLTSLVGILGSAAGVISSLFGQSPVTAAREKLLRENNDALRELARINGDLVRISTPGAKLVSIQETLEKFFSGPRGFDIGKGTPTARGIGRRLLNEQLLAAGLSVADLEKLAKDIGLEIRNQESGLIDLGAVAQLLEAIKNLDTARGESFQDELDNIRSLIRIGVLDPAQEFAATLQAIQKVGAPGLTGALAGIDPFEEQGRADAIKALQDLFLKLAQGGVSVADLGGLSRSEFAKAIEDLIGFLQGDTVLQDVTPSAPLPVESAAMTAALENQVVRAAEQAGLLTDQITVASQQRDLLEEILASLARFQPVTPPALPTGLFSGTSGAGVTVSGPITIAIQVAPGTDAAAQGAAAARGFTAALLDRGLFDQLRLEGVWRGDPRYSQ